jgi:hypothetical protein
LSLPSFPKHDPVFAQIKVKRLFGLIGGWAEVILTSGISGEYSTKLTFWVDEAVKPMEGTAGGMLAYIDWKFLLTHPIKFSISGAQHFGAASITFSHEEGIIGKIDLLGWSVSGMEASGSCEWR